MKKLINSCAQTINDFVADKEQYISVVLVQSQKDQRHCGIAYKFANNCNVIHLSWHYDLKNESDMSEFQDYCAIVSQLDDYRQYAVCAMCDLIKDETNIPYGIFYLNTVFSKEGKLCLGGGEVGLTCATFVLAVFRTSKIDLLDISTWLPREEDSEFQSNILYYLNDGLIKGKVSKDHFDRVKKDVGCARFRPEEVAISSGFKFEDMPVKYEMLKEISIRLSELVNSKFDMS